MNLTPTQALKYVEERHGELLYDLARAEERVQVVKAQLRETEDQARVLRLLTAKKPTETECPPLETVD